MVVAAGMGCGDNHHCPYRGAIAHMSKAERNLARKLPGASQIERVRAARAILTGGQQNEALALEAFMSIFHPDRSERDARRRRGMVRDLRERERARLHNR